MGPGREASGSVPDFNPRSHKGSDRSWPASRRGSETNFNPRSHKGSDRYLSISVRAREFQSTLPQGERRESGSQMCLVHRDFNPRSHKGSDGNPEARCAWCIGISIHAPTRGATTFPPARYGHPGRFQSTLPQGERLKNSVGNRLGMNFNPRSHKGSDRSCGERGQPDIYFNPRSHKGSDFHFYVWKDPKQISIHAPTRGATLVPWLSLE